ncbi:MAG: recombinase family protein [Candidatus Saccharimonadales bacterium]
MKRVAIYARVSTARQEEEETIESQIGAIKDRVKQDELSVDEGAIYKDEGYTGSIIERPSLDRLRDACKERLYDVVYVFDYGRFSRDLTNLMLVKDEIEKREIEVRSLHERITGESAIDRLLLQVMGAFFEYEKKKIAQRFHNGKIQKAKRGDIVGYNPPYGYTYIKKSDKTPGKIEINPAEAAVVKQIFDWVTEDNLSTYAVIKKLAEHGILPRKNKSKYWTRGPIKRILNNETYIGLHHYNKSEAIEPRYRLKQTKYRKQQKTGRRQRPREQWLPCKVDAIITKQQFDEAQKQMQRQKKYRRRNIRHPYLLTGMIECPCGSRRNGDGPDGKKYYRCIIRHLYYDRINRCTVGGLNVQILDRLVWSEIEQLLTRPDVIRSHAEQWLSKRNEHQEPQDDVDSKLKQLRAVENEQRRYVDAYGKGSLSEELFNEKMAETNASLKLIKKQIQESSQNRGEAVKISVDQIVEMAVFKIESLDFAAKRDIVERVIDKVIADPKEVKIWGHLPVNTEKVNYEPKHRNCRSAECWEVDVV